MIEVILWLKYLKFASRFFSAYYLLVAFSEKKNCQELKQQLKVILAHSSLLYLHKDMIDSILKMIFKTTRIVPLNHCLLTAFYFYWSDRNSFVVTLTVSTFSVWLQSWIHQTFLCLLSLKCRKIPLKDSWKCSCTSEGRYLQTVFTEIKWRHVGL